MSDQLQPNQPEIVLAARQITKTFSGVVANQEVSLELHRGEVLGLLGENGAGKTTLMNILYGLYHQDSGEIELHGKPACIASPKDSIANGIGMVHQHFQLVPVMSVAENIALGNERMRRGRLDLDSVRKRIRELSTRYGLQVDPDAYVKDLSVGQQQRVEIIKALYRQASILILDEPTAVLTPQEAEELFAVLRGLKAQGVAIIFITHKLAEIIAVADRIMVMRRGRVVGEAAPSTATAAQLAEMMVGRSVLLRVNKAPREPGAPVLEVEDLHVCDDRRQEVVHGVSLSIREGEVLGIAGVQGNGQTELVQALAGMRPAQRGSMLVRGVDVSGARPREIFERGVAHIPEDRQAHGLVLGYSLADNLVLNRYDQPAFSNRGLLRPAAIRANAQELVQTYDVRPPDPLAQASTLSGGNKQKVIIARELSRELALLIAAHPTRGVDIGSIEFIHQTIVRLREAGTAVLLVSAELDEILALSDRIAVMYQGRIVAVVPAAEATHEQLGLLMAGSR